MRTKTATFPCSRCNGKGRISAFGHVLSGICLKCGGTGRQKSKPAAPRVRWAVFGLDRTTGERARLYNVFASTEEKAIEKARATFVRASTAWKDQYSLENATAVRADPLDRKEG